MNLDGFTGVRMYTAQWCGQCKQIAPHIEQYDFLKVDVDVNEDEAVAMNIRGMPTFVKFLEGKEVGRVAGVNVDKVKQLFEEVF